jgi:cellulose synthase/poly-beta-1,6-N-acetylglucosamine synthase-like glycosyltransferase
MQGLWQKVQAVEFSSLIGSGACAMIIRKPNMCNGANLAYLKSVFHEVRGFAGNENLASGDDEFLMHKIAARYPDNVCFLKSQDAIVETQAHDSMKSFYYQRKRWASKWKHYNSGLTTALAVFIFLANFSLLVAAGLYLADKLTLQNLLIIFSIKFSAEFVFLMLVLSFLRKKKLIWLIPFIQFIYPVYVSFFGLIAQGKNEYIWKGRKLR